jgi:MCP family monocarboxylic acid transporter-like MFS transporter 4
MPYLSSLGMDRTAASMIIMYISIVSIPMRFLFGWLSDIYKKSHVIAVSMVLTSIGLFLFSIIDGSSFVLIVGFVIVYGSVAGAYISLRPPIMREYFGIRKFGTILGLGGIPLTIGVISTPPLAGWVFDIRGVYDPIWLVFSGVCMLGVILMLTLPQPGKSPKPTGS